MNNAIRHTWVVSVGLFLSLFAALSIIQVALTDQLGDDHRNSRQLIADLGAPRGPITVDGNAIAESVPAENSQYDYQRVYRDPHLYSGITGFFSVVQEPTGMESAMNDYLTGQSDSQFFDRISALFTGETLMGAQVELTIDGELQQLAHDLIPDDQRGTIVVQDVNTGEVKAMVSKPTFDANDLAVHSGEQFEANLSELTEERGVSPYYNPALNRPIFPGSTFKLITTLAMLESGDYDPDTELENPQELELPQTDRTLPNFFDGGCSQRTETEFSWIFAQSCNTPFGEAALELGQDPLVDAAERFGWNEGLRIPLYVNPSHFPDEEISLPSLTYSAIGQEDVTATPMQMNMVAAAIANGGQMMQPQLVDSVRGSDLQILDSPDPEVLHDVMDSSTAETLTELMVNTVEEGTGHRADSQNFQVAAKTGTAERGTGDGTVNSWITGFAPADDPQYAVTVVYEGIDMSTGNELTGSQMLTMLEAVMEE